MCGFEFFVIFGLIRAVDLFPSWEVFLNFRRFPELISISKLIPVCQEILFFREGPTVGRVFPGTRAAWFAARGPQVERPAGFVAGGRVRSSARGELGIRAVQM